MKSLFLTLGIVLSFVATGCGSSSSADCTSSAASSGNLCQVNFFCKAPETDHAIYCTGTDCSCHNGSNNEKAGPATRTDYCSLDGEARIEAARTDCGWSL
ncbi:MAG: hypothetical protein KBF88_04250 [Polyangiaceae bacterium]|nr:hypothetical protein [Polyangiaceae bacterium]